MTTTLDLRGLICPLPVLRANKALRELGKGDDLRVLATDPASVKDFAAFCQETGHALVAFGEDQGIYRFVLRKRAAADPGAEGTPAFEIDARWLVEAASRRQKWIDQGQSLNLYLSEPNGKKLDALYKLAWVRGLKTTYYLRSFGDADLEVGGLPLVLGDGAWGESVTQNAAVSPEAMDVLVPDPLTPGQRLP